jgi:spermidine synthase
MTSRLCYAIATTALILNTSLLVVNARISTDEEHAKAQINWMNSSEGGYVNSKIEVRHANPNDPDSRLAMFANANIADEELLIVLPRRNIIDDNYDTEDERVDEDCLTILHLFSELQLGSESKYAPYVNYILDQPRNQLPHNWSPDAQDLIASIWNTNLLPPEEPLDLWDEYYIDCVDTSDPLQVHAVETVLQRSWDDLLLPVFDFMSHRNGHWHNTASNSVHDGTPVRVRAKGDIKAGDEIYTSYNLCEDCGSRYMTYGTPEMFRDYGFVEQYPQRWILKKGFGFEVLQDEEGNVSLDWSDWNNYKHDSRTMKFLVKVRQHLEKTTEFFLHDMSKGEMSDNEFTTIRQFHEDYIQAVDLAIDALDTEFEEDCSESGNCSVISKRYRDLTDDLGRFEYDTTTCDNEDIMEGFDDVYDTFDEIKSHYQFIEFFDNPADKDMCFSLDSTVQICSSYRPQYHEMVVHYTARFLPKINRVLFVGGGDSMLLHEILKYPNLEFVVGLELDQKVTRNSFKYFGTQPHWNNEKVQWWYGDATKSLMMLPKDYFGSFDMVLVDLSETVMSFKVTNGLDIMEALALLLNPDGILVKNEMYFEKMVNIFEHAIQVHYHGVPVICSQGLSMGSNHLKFISQDLTDHGIDSQNLFVQALTNETHHALIHDYAHNKYLSKHCKRHDDSLEKVPSEQEKSPGILMIVEVEDTTVDVQNMKRNTELICQVLEGLGLTILSTDQHENDDTLVVLLKEGYVVARFWSQERYCAFDIHLWSAFWKQVDVKHALVTAVGSGSKSTSSFRIVAGGMFGLQTWKEDEKSRGPRRTDECDQPIQRFERKTIEANLVEEVILEETIKVSVMPNEGRIVVICGKERDGPCQSAETLKRIYDNSHVTTLWTCPDLDGYGKKAVEKMHSCEMNLAEALMEASSDGNTFDSLVLDPKVSLSMHQIIFKIFDNPKNSITLMGESFLLFSLSSNTEEIWRENFAQLFRTHILVDEPLFKSDVIFSSPDATLRLLLVSNDEEHTVLLNATRTAIEEKSGFASELKTVQGGRFKSIPGYKPDIIYEPSDYDDKLPLVQWNSQKPLERQTLFQLELNRKFPLTADEVESALLKTLKSLDIDVTLREYRTDGSGKFYVAMWDGGRLISVWDGRDHVDLNLTTNAKADKRFANTFEKKFKMAVDGITTVLHDEQSRGTGRVVNFSDDVSSDTKPRWAL